MKAISVDLYRQVALALGAAIGSADFFNGSVDVALDGTDARLTLTAIVYRRTVDAPDGIRRPIADIVPVWWEFHTRSAGIPGGETLNDFDFAEVKPFLVEND